LFLLCLVRCRTMLSLPSWTFYSLVVRREPRYGPSFMEIMRARYHGVLLHIRYTISRCHSAGSSTASMSELPGLYGVCIIVNRPDGTSAQMRDRGENQVQSRCPTRQNASFKDGGEGEHGRKQGEVTGVPNHVTEKLCKRSHSLGALHSVNIVDN
jgi:hypothetical protein